MEKRITRQLILSGVFIALGIVLPILFHALGSGSVFLPMHIPVLLSGYFLKPGYALIVGAITPFLSSALTGMPPIFPMVPIMVFELATYGFIVSIISQKIENPFVPLISSMLCGRIVAGGAVWVLAKFFAAKLPAPWMFITGAVAKGMPGILIQLFFIPATIILLEHSKFGAGEESKVE